MALQNLSTGGEAQKRSRKIGKRFRARMQNENLIVSRSVSRGEVERQVSPREVQARFPFMQWHPQDKSRNAFPRKHMLSSQRAELKKSHSNHFISHYQRDQKVEKKIVNPVINLQKQESLKGEVLAEIKQGDGWNSTQNKQRSLSSKKETMKVEKKK